LGDADRLERERIILRHLVRCGVASLPANRLTDLSRHSWAIPDHQVIFDALLRLRAVPPPALRERLAAEATRMGFPDIDWHSFFGRGKDRPHEQATLNEFEWILSLITSLQPTP
jgi:hypothetical protein